MKKILALFDSQIPYNIDFASINEYRKDLKPDILIIGGDFLDCEALFGWHNKSPDKINWNEIEDEFCIGNSILDSLEIESKYTEKHFWIGNHEQRVEDFTKAYSNMKNIAPNIIKDLRLKERKYKVHKQNDLVKFGKLYVYHGDYYGTFHTRKNVIDYERNLLYGHVHSPQLYTKVTPIGSDIHMACAAPCLCSCNPEWLKGKPNGWVNGFVVIYLQDNGDFNLYIVNMIKGSFVAPNGKEYK